MGVYSKRVAGGRILQLPQPLPVSSVCGSMADMPHCTSRRRVVIGIGSALVALALTTGARAADAPALSFDPDGVLLVGDRKVFPIGFTLPPPPDGKSPDGKHAYQVLAD